MEFLKLGLFIATTMFLPGYFLSQILFRRSEFNSIEQIPIWFVLSLGILTIPAILAYLIPTTLTVFLYFVFGVVFLLALIFLIFGRKNLSLSFKDYDWTCLVIFFLAIIYAGILYKAGGKIEGSDPQYNFILLKKLMSRSYISLIDPIHKFTGPAYDYNYSLWFLLLALASKFSGLSVQVVWFIIPAILTPLTIIAYYIFARTVFQNRIIGLVTSLILIGVLGGIWHSEIGFRELNAPYAVSRYILIPIICLFLFSYIFKKQKIFLALTAFLPLTLSNIHAFYFFLYIVTLAGFALFHYLVQRKSKESNRALFIALALSIAVCIPYLALRYISYGIDNPWFSNPHLINSTWFPNGPNAIIALTPRLNYINPSYIFHRIYVIFDEKSLAQLHALLLLPWIFFYLKKRLWATFLCANFICIVGIMVYPMLATGTAKVISYSYLIRMGDILPTFLILGFVSSQVLIFSFKKVKSKMLIMFCVTILILMSAYNGIRNLNHQFQIAHTIKQIDMYPKVYNFLDKEIPGPSVILSDPKTSILCLGYANHYVTSSHIAYSATEANSYEKIQDSIEALNPSTEIGKTLAILKRYETDYILLPPKYSTQPIRQKFEIYNNFFKKVFEEDGYIVYEVIK